MLANIIVMKAIHPLKAGLTLGVLLGSFHLAWAFLVALGWAQAILDVAFWLHFIKPSYVIAPFELTVAALLVVITFCSGFLLAYVFGLVWNRLHLS
jgi:hypothetical protein